MTRRRRVARAAGVTAGRLAMQFLVILLLPFYTRHLTASEYGFGDLVASLAIGISPLVTFGLEQGAFRYLVRDRDSKTSQQQIFLTTFRLVARNCSIALLASVIIAGVLSSLILLVAATYVVLVAVSGYVQWVVRGLDRSISYALGCGVYATVGTSASFYMLVQRDMGASGMLGGLMVGHLAALLFWGVDLARARLFACGTSASGVLSRQLLAYSLPLIPNSVLWWLLTTADRSLIAFYLGLEAVGAFSAAARLAAVASGVYGIAWLIWHETLISTWPNSSGLDSRNSSRLWGAAICLYSAVGSALITAIPSSFSVFIGQEFRSSYTLVPWLILGATLLAMGALLGSFYAAHLATRGAMITTLLAGVASISTALVLIDALGLWAFAASSFVAGATLTASRLVHLVARFHFSVPVWALLLGTIPLATSMGAFYLHSHWFTSASAVAAASVAVIGIASIRMSNRRIGSHD